MPAQWTPVALSPDLPPGVALAVTCEGQDIALWRSATGRLAAWNDRCPHRGMRLSHGFVRGEMLSCIYHGWRYDAAGQCRKIPAHPDLTPPAAIRTTRHHAAEAGGVIWVALEEPTEPPAAREGLVPLRSLTLELSAAKVAAACGITGLEGAIGIDTAQAAFFAALTGTTFRATPAQASEEGPSQPPSGATPTQAASCATPAEPAVFRAEPPQADIAPDQASGASAQPAPAEAARAVLHLLLQPLPHGCAIHALTSPGADRVAASRALEALRRHLEAGLEVPA